MKPSIDKSSLVFTRPILHGGLQPSISLGEAAQQGISNSGGSWNVLITFPESQLHHGLHQKRHDQEVKGGDSPPLFCSCENTWSTVSSSGTTNIIEQVQMRATKMVRRLEHFSYDFLQKCVVIEQGLVVLN